MVTLPVRRHSGSSVTGLTEAISVEVEQSTAAHGALVISRGDVQWPARSPDLSVCDYVLLAYLKSKVYLMKLNDTDELKNEIKREITATPDGKMKEAMRTLRDRLEQ